MENEFYVVQESEAFMKRDVLRKWKHLRGEVNTLWTQITEEDLDSVNGNRHRLVRLLEHRYGLAPERAEREVDLLVSDFEVRLGKAA